MASSFIRYSLLATRYSLLATRYSLLATRSSLLATRNSVLPARSCPPAGLLLDQLAHVLGAAAGGEQIELGKSFLGFRIVNDGVDRLVELHHDRLRGFGRRADGVPGIRDEAGQTQLDHGRDVLENVEPL